MALSSVNTALLLASTPSKWFLKTKPFWVWGKNNQWEQDQVNRKAVPILRLGNVEWSSHPALLLIRHVHILNDNLPNILLCPADLRSFERSNVDPNTPHVLPTRHLYFNLSLIKPSRSVGPSVTCLQLSLNLLCYAQKYACVTWCYLPTIAEVSTCGGAFFNLTKIF